MKTRHVHSYIVEQMPYSVKLHLPPLIKHQQPENNVLNDLSVMPLSSLYYRESVVLVPWDIQCLN